MVTKEQVQSAISALSAMNEEGSITPTYLASVLNVIREYMEEAVGSFVQEFKVVAELSELPASPTDTEKKTAFIKGIKAYVYVGSNGDTADGKYQSVGFGTPTDEQVSDAVDEYMEENPIEVVTADNVEYTEGRTTSLGNTVADKLTSLDSDITGGSTTKTTVTNYALEDLDKDAYYSGTGTSIPDNEATYSGAYGKLLEVKTGDVVVLSTYGGNGCRAWLLADTSKVIYDKAPSPSEGSVNYTGTNAKTFNIEQDGYMAIGCMSASLSSQDDFYCKLTRTTTTSEGTGLKGRLSALEASVTTIQNEIDDVEDLEDDIADIEGKIEGGKNTSVTNYTLSDLNPDVYYGSSDSTLNEKTTPYDSTTSQKFWSILIPVVSGDVINLSTYGGGGARAYVIADSNFNTISRASASANLVGSNAVTLNITQDGYVAISCNSLALSSESDFYCKLTRVVTTIGFQKQIDEIKSHVLESLDEYDNLIAPSESPLKIVKREPGFASIFKDWGFIGGSLCSGEHNAYSADGSALYLDYYWYSFGQYICRATGASGYNYSNGGQSAKGWINATSSAVHDSSYVGGEGGGGWAKAQNEPRQAYIINFSSNDATQMVNGNYGLGTSADINMDDYTQNVESFYGYYGGVIQRLQSISPKCVIFLCTYPNGTLTTAQANTGISNAIREIATLFDNVYLVDIEKYAPIVGSNGSNVGVWSDRYRLQFHFTAAGYQLMAWYIMNYIDWIIRNNYAYFKDVAFIGNDNAFATSDPTKWGNK